MIESLFFQIEGDDKDCTLAQAVEGIREGRRDPAVYLLRVFGLSKIPLAPFAYWVGDGVRRMFGGLPPLEGARTIVKQGLATAADFRFVRTAWETPIESAGATDRRWFPFAKGGNYSPFYADVFLKVNWWDGGKEIKHLGDPTGVKPSSRPQNIDYYFRPGLTWPLRTQSGLALRVVPKDCVFGHKGPCIFADCDNPNTLLSLLGLTCSSAFRALVEIQMAFGSYEVGVLQRTVVPTKLDSHLGELAHAAWRAKREVDIANLTSHAFLIPALAQRGLTLTNGIEAWRSILAESVATVAAAQAEIDELAYSLYGLGGDDRQTLEETLNGGTRNSEETDQSSEANTEDDEAVPETIDGPSLVAELLDYALGCAFGRWDIRYATGERPQPELPDPFDPLPVCPPGMLQNPEGLPAEPKDVPADYPLRISWPGILVDDENHPKDIVARVCEAIEVIWKDRAEAIEQEACDILGVRTLRDYFRRPAAFLADHLKRYSKSRRQAPIYWPLSTKSGSYTLWLYYHRLTDQTLHTCLADFLDPKLRKVQSEMEALTGSGGGGTRAGELREFLDELKDLRDEIERVVKLPWKPNLNDGVLITASPLHKLFRLPKWQKDLKACWDKLAKGDYDWAHLAHTIWPSRVEKACEKDRSIAIAHGREDLCKIEPPKPKKGRGKKTKEEESQEDDAQLIEED